MHRKFGTGNNDLWIGFNHETQNPNSGSNVLILKHDTGNMGLGTTDPTSKLQVVGLPEYADNAAATAGGLSAGAFYRTGDLLKVVH